ncbi:MAG: hypothetical protein KFW07_01090 [Mycoplasmataceae bacterium]|nr:hypothetical protein [Mycoplasmataceae bacterium]
MSTKIQSLKVIENAKKNNKFSHAYLFFGELGVDVFEAAFEAIKLMICENDKCMSYKNIEELNYPDLIVINPEKNLISKESIVSTLKEVSNTSLVNNKKKILIIKDVHLGNNSSLNSLLKFIEEPPKNTYIIMTTNRIDFLISTIKSRAQNIMIKRPATNEIIKDFIKLGIKEKYIRLFANTYPNIEKINEIDLLKFETTYSKIMKALEVGIDHPNRMKLDLSNIIAKDNFSYSMNILEYFYFQVQTLINDDHPLFPNHIKLINQYKDEDIDYSKIHNMISIFKKSIINRGNFNLQKENFLLKLLELYDW